MLPLLLLGLGLLFNARLNQADNLSIKRHSGQVYAVNDNRELRTEFFNTRQANHLFTLKDAQTQAKIGVRFEQPESTQNNPAPRYELQENRQVLAKDVLPDTDIRYQIIPDVVKEEIVLRSQAAIASPSASFSFLLTLTELAVEQDASGALLPRFVHTQSGTVYELQPPYMQDAAGVISYAVGLRITEAEEKDTYRVVLTPDTDWLENPARVYPVIIDPTVTKGADPLAYWKFDEAQGDTAYDSMGDYDATLGVGTSAPQRITEDLCKAGKCLAFDGGDDYATVPDQVMPDIGSATAFTISAWVRKNGPSSGVIVMDGQEEGGSADGSWYLYYEESSKAMSMVLTSDTWNSYCQIRGSTDIADSKWHHVTAVVNRSASCTSNDILLYVDGARQSTTVPHSAINTNADIDNDDPLTIGAYHYNGTYASIWSGSIDDLKIYHYARSPDQIKRDYVGGSPGGSSAVLGSENPSALLDGLIGYWKMDEATGSTGSSWTVLDASGHGNHGVGAGNASITTGKYGNGGNFENTGDYVLVERDPSLNHSGPMTWSAWVYPATGSGDQAVIMHKGSNLEFSTNQYTKLRFRLGTTAGLKLKTTQTNVLTYDTWQHVVLTWDGTMNADSAKMYVNGQDVTEGSTTDFDGGSYTAISTDNQDIRFASRGSAFNLKGQMDEVLMLKRALDPSEVKALYERTPGPVVYYNFDENTGSTANDSSTNDHPITLPAGIGGDGYVKSVEYVEITLGTGESTDSTALTKGQTIADSVPFVTTMKNTWGDCCADDDFRINMVDISLEAGPQVTATRSQSSGTIEVGVYVVEFDTSKVDVQQGTLSIGNSSTSNTSSITTVDQTKAAMVFYYQYADTAENDDFDDAAVAGWFSANDTLSWQRDGSVGSISGHYYVFEAFNDEFSVQADSFSMSGTTSATASLSPAVDMTKSFVVGSYRTNVGNDDASSGAVALYLASTSTVGAVRYTSDDGNISDIRTFTIEFAGNESVQRGTFTYADGDGQETASITEVGLDTAIAWNPNTIQGMMRRNSTGSADVPGIFQRLKLTDSTTVQGDRESGGTGGTTEGRWEVIEFAAGDGPQPQWSPGKFGSGLTFDGSNDYVTVSDDPQLTFQHFTISSWIKWNQVTSNAPGLDFMAVVSKGSFSSGEYTILAKRQSSNVVFNLYIQGALRTSWTTGGLDGNWHHLAATYDGATAKLYFDGVEKSSSAASVTITDSSSDLGIGRQTADTNYPWAGQLDDIRIYTYARSSAQIIEDMNGGHPLGGSPVSSQFGYWKFDEGHGTTVNNAGSAGSALDGDIYGMASPPTSTSGWSNDGIFGKALRFDGADDYVAITSPNLPTGDFTYSVWFYMSAPASSDTILWAGDGSGNNEFKLDHPANAVIRTRINHSTVCDGTTVPVADIWNHYLVTRTGSSVTGYLNGVQDCTGTNSNTLDFGSCPFLIGADDNSAACDYSDITDTWRGQIDEVKVYAAAMTPQQAKVEYTRGKAIVLGATSTDSSGSSDNSAAREYCIPGDTASCDPPVGEWRMDENTGTDVYDSSGNGNNGSLTDSGWTPGKFGSGLVARRTPDGTVDEVTITDPASGILDFDETQDFSFSTWIRATNLENNIMPIYKGAADTSTAGYQLRVLTSTDLPACYYTDGSGSGIEISNATTTITDGDWYHVTCVMDRDGSEVGSAGYHIFVNGVLEGSDTSLTEGSSVNSTDLQLIEPNAVREFDGALDTVRIYDYARTRAQVAWEYSRGGPVAWYKLDECSGTSIYNSAYAANGEAAGNDGTLVLGSGGNTTVGTCTTSGAWFNGQSGKRNASLDFDGTDDFVGIADDAVFDFSAGNPDSPFSLAAWVNMDEATSFTVLGKTNNTTAFFVSTGFEWDFLTNPSDFLQMRIFDSAASVYIGQQSVQALTAYENQWIHVVGTYDGSGTPAGIKLYLNGILIPSSALSSGSYAGIDHNTHSVTIGGEILSHATFRNFSNGQIDDVRIYNYALTANQIKTLVNDGAVSFR